MGRGCTVSLLKGKQVGMQCKHPTSPRARKRKSKFYHSARKVMSSVFLDANGAGHFEAKPRATANKADSYLQHAATRDCLRQEWTYYVARCYRSAHSAPHIAHVGHRTFALGTAGPSTVWI